MVRALDVMSIVQVWARCLPLEVGGGNSSRDWVLLEEAKAERV